MMTTYFYKAKRDNADTVLGQIAADTQEDAIDLINQLGLIPVEVDVNPVEEEDIVLPLRGKVSHKERYFLIRQMANLLRSGMPLLRTLQILKEEMNGYLQKVIACMYKDIKNGKSLSDCLKDYPKVFPDIYISMIHYGEESGELPTALTNLADYQQKQLKLISQIKSALAYPIFMAIAGLVTVVFIFTFVLPKMLSLFSSFKVDLPMPTQIVVSIGQFFQNYGIFAIIGLFVIIGSIALWLNTKSGLWIKNKISLSLPLFGNVLLNTDLIRFSRGMALLLKNEVSLIKALDVATPLIENSIVREKVSACKDDLLLGGSLGKSLKNVAQIPSLVGHLIATGEETGKLHDIFDELVYTYEQDVDEKVKMLSTLLEPALILSVGLVIGLIVFAILLPIFQVDSLI